MVLLTTYAKVLDRLANIQGHAAPAGLTQARVEDVITGVSAILLRRSGLTAAPAAGLQLDALVEVCVELCVLKLRVETDTISEELFAKRWEQVLGNIPIAEAETNMSSFKLDIAGASY